MRKVHTYSYYKGKAFVAAQIRRRLQIAYMRAMRSHLTKESIDRWYAEAIAAAKKHAKYMVERHGQTIYVED